MEKMVTSRLPYELSPLVMIGFYHFPFPEHKNQISGCATMSRISAEKVLTSAKGLIDFIHASPSPYHVVDVCRKRLIGAGFTELSEKQSWNVIKGGKYFLTRNQSTLVAFTVGEKYEAGNGFSIIGAHTDSPCLKLKPRSKRVKSGYLSVGVQCYGGGSRQY